MRGGALAAHFGQLRGDAVRSPLVDATANQLA